MNKPGQNPSTIRRLDVPLNETMQQWLMPLLHACYITDKAIGKAQKKGRQLACMRCSSGHKNHKDILEGVLLGQSAAENTGPRTEMRI